MHSLTNDQSPSSTARFNNSIISNVSNLYYFQYNYVGLYEKINFIYILNMVKENIIKKEIYRDSRWLIIKPLSFEASLKYGGNTKWCTSSKKYPLHFYEYSNEGILIYVIERKTNVKWAVYWEILDGEKSEMSWWNSDDRRIDSIQTSIPEYIMGIVKRELFTEPKPNYHYLNDSEINRHEHLITEIAELEESNEYHAVPDIEPTADVVWPIYTSTNTFKYSSDDIIHNEMYHRVVSTTLKNYINGTLELDD